MKRLWSTHAFVAGQKIRARKRDRRRRTVRDRRSTPMERRRPRVRQNDQRLVAPGRLDLFGDTHETVRYCNQLRQALLKQGTRIFMDLSAVETSTSDSLLVLRAIMDASSRAPDTHVGGNLPLDAKVASEFKASGFFEGFAKPPADLPQPKGLMKKKSYRMVYSRVAAELVDFAAERTLVTHECANASSQNLVEAMTNTHNHAGYPQRSKGSRRRQHERWWASVYCRDNVSYFSFVDLGVGILKSAPAKGFLRKLQKSGVMPASGRASLLKDAFEGRIGSATGKPGRGLGLPRMRKHAKEGRLLQLQVLTSDVVGSVVNLDFGSASHSLRGTVFRWQTGREGGEQ